MTQEQLRADVETLHRTARGQRRLDKDALARILAIVEPLAGLSATQVAILRADVGRSERRARKNAELDAGASADAWTSDADAYAALARMLGGGR